MLKNTVYLKLTNACNLRCPFCYNIKANKVKLNLEKVIHVLEEISPDKIIFHGGEPLLAVNDSLAIINYFKHINFSITSNLTAEITDDVIQLLKQCEIATSYSCDRFINKNSFDKFINNIQFIKEELRKDITLLITLSENQLKQSINNLLNTIELIQPKHVMFERLYFTYDVDKEYKKEFYKLTDNYLFNVFSVFKDSRNMLMLNMLESIKNNTSVYPTKCSKNIFTIEPNGSYYSCPNLGKTLNNLNNKRDCIKCSYFKYCQSDCESFRDVCGFPKKTFDLVKRLYEDGNLS